MQPAPEVLRFIEGQRVAHLATADAQGRPHVVPVCFVYLDGHFYSVVDEKPKRTRRLKRLRNIEENPQAALVLDEYGEDWSRLAWVMVQGRATVLEDGEEAQRAIAALRRKYQPYRSMALEGMPVIRITAERMISWGAL